MAALLIAGWEVYHGRMDIGGFVAVQAYITSMFAPLNWLGMVYQGTSFMLPHPVIMSF